MSEEVVIVYLGNLGCATGEGNLEGPTTSCLHPQGVGMCLPPQQVNCIHSEPLDLFLGMI